jgi:hypothetical protein
MIDSCFRAFVRSLLCSRCLLFNVARQLTLNVSFSSTFPVHFPVSCSK